MSSHLRHCPKHRKPLPCSHCALMAKPALAPTPEIVTEPRPPAIVEMDPPKSASAIRAAKWREQHKQNPEFNAKEAKRKKQERGQQKQDPVVWSRQHPEFPLTLDRLHEQDKHGGLYLTEAPRGKGKLIPYGASEQIEKTSGDQTADAVISELPRRAQFTDEELQKKLADAGIDLQSKINLILEHWKHDEEFCALLNSWSLDEIAEFVRHCSENLEYARELLYEHTEHQARAQVLTHAQPHGERVAPEGVSDNHEGDLPHETDRTFARKIGFKKAFVQTLRIGNRNARFYNLQNGTAEQHFENFIRTNSDPQSVRDENSDLVMPDAQMVCKLCQREIAPRFSVESGFEHFGTEHRQEVIDHIRWWEAKAWRPTRRVCDRNHAALAARHGSGLGKIYCACGKLLYKPAKPKRSDMPEEPLVGMPDAA